MAATLVPTTVESYAALAQLGTVYTYVVLTWAVPVQLTGVPPIMLNDGLGNTHAPERAAPHIATEADWSTQTRFRYQGVPSFAELEVVIPTSATGIEDADGNTTASGAHPAPPVEG